MIWDGCGLYGLYYAVENSSYRCHDRLRLKLGKIGGRCMGGSVRHDWGSVHGG